MGVILSLCGSVCVCAHAHREWDSSTYIMHDNNNTCSIVHFSQKIILAGNQCYYNNYIMMM